MAETDWTAMTDELAPAALDRGVTSGFAVPNGGGSFTFGFNSLVSTAGAACYYTNQAGFAPTGALKGGSIRGALKKAISGGDTDYAAFLAIQAQGTSVNDHAYLLGLSDDEPARIVLAKVPIVSGIASSPAAGALGVLSVSTNTIAKDTFVQLRLDAIVNANGDVLLQAFENADIATNDVASPVWTAIAGLSNFVDDQLGTNSGIAGVASGFHQPFTAGRMGFGFYTNGVSRRGVFDHLEAFKQN